jgi:predicted NAD/FAD-dependent oxidoreductase
MRTREWHGSYFELGASFIATPGFDDALLEELGILGERIVGSGAVRFKVWRDGRAHEFAYGGFGGMLRFTGMTWGEKARLLRVRPDYARMYRSLEGHYDEPWRGAWADEESVEAWLTREDPAFLEYVVEPMFELYCGWEPANFGKAAFLATAFLPQLPALYTFRRGLATLPRALASRLDVTTSARVTKVDLERNPVVVEWEHAGKRHTATADTVLVAVPGSRVLDFTRGLTPQRRFFFERVAYVPHDMAYFMTEGRPEGVPQGVLFPRREDGVLTSIGYHGNLINPNLEFLGIGLKTAYLREHLNDTDEQALDAKLEIATRRFPSLSGIVRDRMIGRWREALPAFPAGSMRRLADFVALPPQRGIAFAGDYLCTGATSAAYRTGQWAAADLLRLL